MAIVRVPTASSSARSWETSRTAPLNARSASSSASRLSMSRWFVGSSRIRTFGGFSAPASTAIAASNLEPPVEQLEDHPARSLRRRERELQAALLARPGLDSLHLRKLLDARLRLACLRGLVAEALDEALHPRDLRALRLDRPA